MSRVMIVAGEASGDLHGGNLAAQLRRLSPGIELVGMGGQHMRQNGVNTLVDIAGMAVVGVWEVLAHLKEIMAAFRTLEAELARGVDLLVLIDYPDFNLRLAAKAKKAGIPVVYYVSPQIWAWRRGRVKKMARLVRRMLVVFPFEEVFYRDAGVDVRFVGHPLLDALEGARDAGRGRDRGGRGRWRGRGRDRDRDRDRERSREREQRRPAVIPGLEPDSLVMGLLPGSRRREVDFHLPVMLDSFKLMREQMPSLQAIIPVAPTLDIADIRRRTEGVEGLVLVENDTDGALDRMDAAIVASGTATLQTALHRVPMVIVYRLSPLTYRIGKMLVKVPFIGMVNIVAGREVVPELIQGAVTPEAVVERLLPYFTDLNRREEVLAGLDEVRLKLGGPGASRRAAEAVLELLP